MGKSAPSRVILFFVDGLGAGPDDRDRNPLARVRGRVLSQFSDKPSPPAPYGGVRVNAQATLGLPGLPQSATGQTTLFTGVNASEHIGRHLQGFPNAALRELLLTHSILKRAVEAGWNARFLNAFRPPFFEQDPHSILGKLSASTVAALASGRPFFDLDDLRAERCLYQDFTNRHLLDLGYEMPERTPEEAGRILSRAVLPFDFVLYEYFKTDRAGHRTDMDEASKEIEKLEAFLEAALSRLDFRSTLFILTSDHGNIEDLSFRGHTRNPALTIVWGPGAAERARAIRSIQDVPGVLLEALAEGREDRGQGAGSREQGWSQ